MELGCFFLFDRSSAGPVFAFLYTCFIFLICAGVILWHRIYRRKWQQSQAQHWERLDAQFDEGEIIPMLKGRSDTIAGYTVMFAYTYDKGGYQVGIYTSLETKTREESEALLGRLANRHVVVRVAPVDPCKSRVLDADLPLS